MTGPGYSIGGYITRSNMNPPLSNLDIQVDPYWMLLGDTADDASTAGSPGVEIGLTTHKKVYASSPYVAGSQLVLATPDNSPLSLRLICDGGGDINQAMDDAGVICQAVSQQLTYQVVLNYDVTQLGWNCYTGDYQIAINQLWLFGYLLPVYLAMDKDPTPVFGPI